MKESHLGLSKKEKKKLTEGLVIRPTINKSFSKLCFVSSSEEIL